MYECCFFTSLENFQRRYVGMLTQKMIQLAVTIVSAPSPSARGLIAQRASSVKTRPVVRLKIYIVSANTHTAAVLSALMPSPPRMREKLCAYLLILHLLKDELHHSAINQYWFLCISPQELTYVYKNV